MSSIYRNQNKYKRLQNVEVVKPMAKGIFASPIRTDILTQSSNDPVMIFKTLPLLSKCMQDEPE